MPKNVFEIIIREITKIELEKLEIKIKEYNNLKLKIEESKSLEAKNENSKNLKIEIEKLKNLETEIDGTVIKSKFKKAFEQNEHIDHLQRLSAYNDFLIKVIKENRPFLLKWLLTEKNISPFHKDENNNNGLHIAIEKGYTEIAELLIENKILTNFRENKKTVVGRFLSWTGWSSLQSEKNHPDNLLVFAIQKRQTKIVDLMLNNYDSYSKELVSKCLTLAIQDGQEKIVDLMLNNYNSFSAELVSKCLTLAVQEGQEKIVDLMLNTYDFYSEDVNFLSECLYIAAEKGFAKITERLLETKNVDIDIEKGLMAHLGMEMKFIYSTFWTPLVAAIKNNHSEIVKQLVLAGARVNFNPNNINAIQIASELGHAESLEVLLKLNANDVNEVLTFEGMRSGIAYSALYLAVFNNHTKIVKMLVKAGAKHNYEYKVLGEKITLMQLAKNGKYDSEIGLILDNAEKIREKAIKNMSKEEQIKQVKAARVPKKTLDEIPVKATNGAHQSVENFSSRSRKTNLGNNSKPTTNHINPNPHKNKSTKSNREKITTTKSSAGGKTIANQGRVVKSSRTPNKSLSLQSTEVAESKEKIKKAEEKALQKQASSKNDRKAAIEEQQKASSKKQSDEYNLYIEEINNARKTLVSKIDPYIWVVFRDEDKDHQKGRPGIKVYTKNEDVYVLLGTTRKNGKNKQNLTMQLKKEGAESYFWDMVKVNNEKILHIWDANLKLTDNQKIVVSNLVPIKFLLEIFPDNFANATITNLSDAIEEEYTELLNISQPSKSNLSVINRNNIEELNDKTSSAEFI